MSRPQRLFGRTAHAVSHSLKQGLLGCSVACVLVWGCQRGNLGERDSLAAALAAVRPGEGRLVGASWLETGTRKPGLEAAIRSAARALRERRTAATLRNDAIVSLLSGEVDHAIDELSKAAELAPSDAALWSDLAAAHLQRSTAASDPYEIVLALAASNRSVHCDPTLQAGRFNRALALERLSMRGQAEEEWQLVFRRERDPLWAREAHRHAMALTQQEKHRDWQRELAAAQEAVEQGKLEQTQEIVADSPQSFREHLEEKLLANWVTLEHEHRALDARRELDVARAIANALVSAGGDRLAFEAISQIDHADETELRRLEGGFFSYFEGLRYAQRNDFSHALPFFRKAEEDLANESSPFAGWARFQIALCRYQEPEYKEARKRFLDLAQSPDNASYKVLRGRSWMLVGLIDGIQGDLTSSLHAFETAESTLREAREIPLVVKSIAFSTTVLTILGQPKEAWRRIYTALIEPAAFERRDIWFFTCESASWLAQEQGEIEIAVWFQNEVVKSSRGMGPAGVLGALRQRAVLLAALGRKTEAERDLAEAYSALQEISDPPLRRMITGDLLLVESELAGMDSPKKTIALLNQAIPIFRETGYHYRLGDAFHQRAWAEMTLGQKDAAERDLAEAIAELERQRETVAGTEDRISYFDRVKKILDTMIAFQLEQRHRADEALRFSEQAKARVLWDWIVARPTQEPGLPSLQTAASNPIGLPSIQRDLPEGTAVIEYAVLPHKTVLWVLHRKGDLQCAAVEISAEAVSDLVHQVRRALLEGHGNFAALSEQAYMVLIQPIAHHLAPGERLVFIPDGPLHALPFSLLRDPQRRHYLLQDRAVMVAPSARAFAASRRRDLTLAQRPAHVLVAAAPDFDRAIDSSLQALSAGKTDASIARIFPGSQVLRERGATRDAFLRSARNFEILHFGGHSIVNMDSPLHSQMLFAKDPADPTRGVLYSGDVLRQSFPKTRLVVLASCNTALGRISRTEGVENLARPFLAAGVPTVIASLWNVDDQVTADFFLRFYQHLKQRFDVAEALRVTQIESLAQSTAAAPGPRSWGAFEVIGAGGDTIPPLTLSADR